MDPRTATEGRTLSTDGTPGTADGPASASTADDPAAAELAVEQAAVDLRYSYLDAGLRRAVTSLDRVRRGPTAGTPGALTERDAFDAMYSERIAALRAAEDRLVFGRMDLTGDASRYIGRIGLSDEHQEQVLYDWRSPAAEPFYRATASHRLGVTRRRHLTTSGREVTRIEDDVLDVDAHAGSDNVQGEGSLLAALGAHRTGRMRDIVATIQGEQDRIIRTPLPGVLLVQGGPGTGKTAVALHRAAYLLFTHRATLERQGVLVVGPNPLFLNYIENVLPSLGESGVTLSTISGLVTNVTVRASESDEVDRLKGDVRMVTVLAQAVSTRERALRADVEVPVGRAIMVLRARETREVIERARRRPGNHNQRRSAIGRELASRLASQYYQRFIRDEGEGASGVGELADQIRATPEFQAALQRMWPRLTGQELLHDLFGAPALVRAAGAGVLTEAECELLVRPRSASLDDVAWTKADAALIDEARVLLGPRRRPRAVVKAVDPLVLDGVDLDSYRGDVRAAALREAARQNVTTTVEFDEAEFVTYGHIVVDEAQDLSPMELRILHRRDLTGSMTIVGDMGQATTASSSASWDTVLAVLDPRRPPTRVDLTVSYRTPEEVLRFAAPVLALAAPDLDPPRPVRRVGVDPIVEVVAAEQFDRAIVAAAARERAAVDPGRTAVIVSESEVERVVAILRRGGLAAVNPREDESVGLAADLVVLAAESANGLEFDAVVVLEPLRIARRGSASDQLTNRGLRTLYVAMTRPTRRLALVTTEALPASML